MISIVVPVYNEEENVALLHQKIVAALTQMGESYEIIFVDDGSTDQTVEKLKALPHIKIILLTMDFGQTSALDAGIHEAQGEIIVTMDGDLQNDPADVPMMVSKLREGYDVVSGWRKERYDPVGRKVLSRLANWLIVRVTKLSLHDSACALKAYRRDMVQSLRMYGDMHVFLPAYLHGRGARVTELPVRHHARQFGVSKHYFMRAVKDIFDLITLRFFLSMSRGPLFLFGGLGMICFCVGMAVAVFAIYLKFTHLRDFSQTPLPILTVFFILSSIILFMLGLLAELVLRVYFEVNQKTPYIIREKIETK